VNPLDLHFSSLVLDAHKDIYELNDRIDSGEEFPLKTTILPRLREAGVDIVFWAIGGDSWLHSNCTDLRLKGALSNWARFERQITACDGDVIRVETADEFPENPDGKLRIVYGIEGGMPLQGRLDLLEAFYALGVRVLQPTWNYRNELADGALESGIGGGGLSQFGVQVIQHMNRLGMLVDLAHITEAGAFDALEVTQEPVVVSHGNVKTICPHPRNIGDDLIDAIAELGGCIGVQWSPGRVDRKDPTLERLVDHIEYIVERVGIDHVGIGLDKIEFTGVKPPQDTRFSTNEPKTLRGFKDVRDLPKITALMSKRGFSDGDVRKVLADNFLRVFKQVTG